MKAIYLAEVRKIPKGYIAMFDHWMRQPRYSNFKIEGFFANASADPYLSYEIPGSFIESARTTK